MISTVEKIYTTDLSNNEIINFKITYSNGEIWIVKNNSDNRHYQAIQEWIAEGNTVIDNGGNN
jgi:hypothetical protein